MTQSLTLTLLPTGNPDVSEWAYCHWTKSIGFVVPSSPQNMSLFTHLDETLVREVAGLINKNLYHLAQQRLGEAVSAPQSTVGYQRVPAEPYRAAARTAMAKLKASLSSLEANAAF